MKDIIEDWAIQISKNISDITPTFANDGYPNEAELIVEPWTTEPINDKQRFTRTEYYKFAEEDSENWAQWIRETFGNDWGTVADTINIEGY